MKNTKLGIKISRKVITSIRTSGDFNTSRLTSSESIQSMNKRIEKNIRRCEKIIEQGNQNINNMLVGNIENVQESFKRKKLTK